MVNVIIAEYLRRDFPSVFSSSTTTPTKTLRQVSSHTLYKPLQRLLPEICHTDSSIFPKTLRQVSSHTLHKPHQSHLLEICHTDSTIFPKTLRQVSNHPLHKPHQSLCSVFWVWISRYSPKKATHDTHPPLCILTHRFHPHNTMKKLSNNYQKITISHFVFIKKVLNINTLNPVQFGSKCVQIAFYDLKIHKKI